MAVEAGGTAVARRRVTRTGVVISDKMDKTIVVAVVRRVGHQRYSRVVSRTSKFYAHDEKNVCKVGDVVTIVESRPLSRLKRWRVRSVLREGKPVLHETADTVAVDDTGRPAPKRRSAKQAGEAAGPDAGTGGEV